MESSSFDARESYDSDPLAEDRAAGRVMIITGKRPSAEEIAVYRRQMLREAERRMIMMNNLYAELIGKNVNPMRRQIKKYLNRLSVKYNVPAGALVALIGAESDFRQFDKQGNPLGNPNSSAVGLGQILKGTAALYGFNMERLGRDWKYNLNAAVAIFAWGYNHPYIKRNFSSIRERSAAAYDVYHDGKAEQFKNRSKLLNRSYEDRYLKYYDQD
jgi:hypothetical protein